MMLSSSAIIDDLFLFSEISCSMNVNYIIVCLEKVMPPPSSIDIENLLRLTCLAFFAFNSNIARNITKTTFIGHVN